MAKQLGLADDDVGDYHRICSRHFPNGDITQVSSMYIGKKFRSPKKMWTARAKRAAKRKQDAGTHELAPNVKRHLRYGTSPTPTSTTSQQSDFDEAMLTPIGEPLLSDYSVHELPDECSSKSALNTSGVSGYHNDEDSANVIVNTALLTRIEALESSNRQLNIQLSAQKKDFRLEHISHDSLMHFYTGFHSYELLLAFFEFLGPAVNNLTYWGRKKSTLRKKKTKLDPLNQFFLTLIKLRLNLRERDIAYRFGIATSTASKYFITWIYFLYHHLSELQWMPTVEQVRGNLPQAFKDKFPDTYAIIDATEVFIETPCDLHNQSSTWSNYKHHNTAKLLVGCTPNGAICFLSHLYVGSISDVELTQVSGFIEALHGKAGVAIMADRGFTIKNMLSPLGVKLNIPPFMEGRAKLPLAEVTVGRKIASLRIHVERVIGRIKKFAILKGTVPLSMSRIFNEIVCACGWLVNFQPVLIPPVSCDIEEVDEYFNTLSSDSDYDADTELSDTEFCD